MSKKERDYANSNGILKNLLCCFSNLSNDPMKTGVENETFWSGIGSGVGEPGGTPQRRTPRNPAPLPPPPTPGSFQARFKEIQANQSLKTPPSFTPLSYEQLV